MAIEKRKLFYLVQCAFRRDPAEPVHQAERLNAFNEIVRIDQSKFGVIPARECFDSRDNARGDIDLRLVVEEKLFTVKCFLQVSVGDGEPFVFLGNRWFFGSEICAQQFLQLPDREWLLKMSDYCEPV